MNCKEINTLFIDFIENKLNPKIETQVSNHIFECEKCNKKYENFKKYFQEINILKNEKPEISSFFTEKIISLLKNEENEHFVVWNWINQTLFKKPQVIVATAFSVLIGGFIGGIITYNVQVNNNLESLTSNKELLVEEEDFYIAGITNYDIYYLFENNN